MEETDNHAEISKELSNDSQRQLQSQSQSQSQSILGSPTRSLRNKDKRMPPPPPPPHLSEFISYVNGNGLRSNDTGNNEIQDKVESTGLDKVEQDLKTRLALKKKKNIINNNNNNNNSINITSSANSGTWSIGSNRSITSTTMDLDVLVTKKDIKESLSTFKELNNTSDELIDNLKKVSESFGKFGSIMEKISRNKCSGKYCEMISTFSNYQYLISNQHRYLSEIIEREFKDHIGLIEIKYVKSNSECESIFQAEYIKLIKELKIKEKMENKLRRGKTRNLILYKNNLSSLSNKLDDIDSLRHDYYIDMFNLLEDAHGEILKHAKTVVEQESVIFDKLAEKAKPGNGLDKLIDMNDDDNDNDDNDDDDDGEQDVQNENVQEDENVQNQQEQHENENVHYDNPGLQNELYMKEAIANLCIEPS
jgi:hypothetical protein